mmetsp:Transcript_10593/g.28108  ORF Transcript_10593/g.28108 Transcript_10593/m.28108 type:complete len:337 (+) Transcript_10593:661-1671(+)
MTFIMSSMVKELFLPSNNCTNLSQSFPMNLFMSESERNWSQAGRAAMPTSFSASSKHSRIRTCANSRNSPMSTLPDPSSSKRDHKMKSERTTSVWPIGSEKICSFSFAVLQLSFPMFPKVKNRSIWHASFRSLVTSMTLGTAASSTESSLVPRPPWFKFDAICCSSLAEPGDARSSSPVLVLLISPRNEFRCFDRRPFSEPRLFITMPRPASPMVSSPAMASPESNFGSSIPERLPSGAASGRNFRIVSIRKSIGVESSKMASTGSSAMATSCIEHRPSARHRALTPWRWRPPGPFRQPNGGRGWTILWPSGPSPSASGLALAASSKGGIARRLPM